MLSDKAVQCGAVDAELLGRKGQISSLLVDRFLEELLFQLFESLFLPFAVAAESFLTYSRHQDRLRKVLHGDERPRGIGQGPLHRVLQLPHIPRPIVMRQPLHRLGRDAFDRLAGALRSLFQKMGDQEWNVFTPLPQGGHPNFDDVDAEEQVLPEPARPDFFAVNPLRGGKEAIVKWIRLPPSQPTAAPPLQAPDTLC